MSGGRICKGSPTTLVDAARVMLEHKIGCLVVVESQKVVGILAESDFVKLVIPPGHTRDGAAAVARDAVSP